MAVDRYTKIVLTVIAVSLVYLCLGLPGVVPAARAQAQPTQPTRVVIVGYSDSAIGNGFVHQLPMPVTIEQKK